MSYDDKPTGYCAECRQTPAEVWWVPDNPQVLRNHGLMEPSCELCALRREIDAATKQAARLPELIQRLVELECARARDQLLMAQRDANE